MPEGDTIHKAAATLRRGLVGRELTAIRAPRLRHRLPEPGRTVTAVEARGKHLLIHLDDGHVFHTHLRMSGAWDLYRPGAPWRRPATHARLVLTTADAVAVCFDAPVVELLDEPALRRHPDLRRLGPDLSLPDPDVTAIVARVATLAVAGTPVVEVLLDQRIAAGIGNVIASETAFVAGVAPTDPIERIDEPTRAQLYATASDLLQANLETSSRTTVPDRRPGTLWVYGRAGRPCRRCGTPVVMQKVGRGARPTFWCPTCQPSVTARPR
jgi:endonuclease VIII